MSAQICVACMAIFTITASTGQNNGYKPTYNYQSIARQPNPSSNVLPSKKTFNTGINFGKPAMQPKAPASDDVPHLEVMDFFVPSYPFAGKDFEMTCGYKHQDGLTFQRIEWHRNKMMFFRYINERGHIYSHDWVDESRISYHTQHIDIGKQQNDKETSKVTDNLTVLKLRLHKAESKMSGMFECQIFMSMIRKDEELHVPANRTALVKVIDPNDPEDFKPNIRIENNTVEDETGLDCIGEGNPAPYLVWSSVQDDGKLNTVSDESLEFFPVEFDEGLGVETSKLRFTGPFSGQYACTADSRGDKKEVHFIETEMNAESLSWIYKGTTTTTAAPVVVEEPDHTNYWIMIAAGSSSLAFCVFIVLVCCCCCCARRRKKEKKRRRLVEAMEAERSEVKCFYTAEEPVTACTLELEPTGQPADGPPREEPQCLQYQEDQHPHYQ